ncbi:MAG TPA: hypothetical protein VE861_12645 [Gemmatimonadaceae bacterium]|nr:hypothetical protein [Gemmatimonadaceae bacterium]
MLKKLLLTAALSVVAVATAAAQSISGEWDAAMNTPGGPRPFKVMFVQDGEKLTGTVKRSFGDLPLEGTIKGNDIKFRYMQPYNGNQLTMTVTTTLAGTEMKGQVDIAGQMQEAFSAKRAAAATTPNPH